MKCKLSASQGASLGREVLSEELGLQKLLEGREGRPTVVVFRTELFPLLFRKLSNSSSNHKCVILFLQSPDWIQRHEGGVCYFNTLLMTTTAGSDHILVLF